MTSYDLRAYDFDITQEITVGVNANHLMKADNLINEIVEFQRNRLTKIERVKYSILFFGTEVIFISDIPLTQILQLK